MKKRKGCMVKGIQAAIGVLLFAGTAFGYEDADFSKKSAGLAGLFDEGAAVETQAFSQEIGAPEQVKAEALIQVMAAIYVPVLPEGQETTLEIRVVGLGQRHGFILDKGFKPVRVQDSREPGRTWQGSGVFLVRGWVQESKLAGLKADPVVESLRDLDAWSPQQDLIEAMKPWVEKYAKVRREYVNDDGILGNALKAVGLKCLVPKNYRGVPYHKKFSPRCAEYTPADLLEAVKNRPDLTAAQAEELKRMVAAAMALTKRDWERTTGGAPSDGMTYNDIEHFLAVLEVEKV